jgi:hypothetical protein
VVLEQRQHGAFLVIEVIAERVAKSCEPRGGVTTLTESEVDRFNRRQQVPVFVDHAVDLALVLGGFEMPA